MYAKYANPDEVVKAVDGKICDPRLKSHRKEGRERDPGWDCRMGMSKRVRDRMEPEERSAAVMLKIWIGVAILVVVLDGVERA